MYTSVQKKTHLRHVVEEEDSDAGTEMYSLDDLPRVTSLNNEEVQSIDSALISAEEQDLMDSSSGDVDLSHPHKARYSKNPSQILVSDDAAARRMSPSRRISAVSAARRASSVNQSNYISEENMRRVSVASSDAVAMTPSTLRRNVSAFGEITVMPVGDDEDEELQVTVSEEFQGTTSMVNS